MTDRPAVSAVIVHYRGGEHVRRCISTCLAIPRISEVIVVDNEGVAGVLQAEHTDPRVTVVQAPRNLGFGRAANVGMAMARSDTALVLNQDVELTAEAVDAMYDAGRDSGAWIVGPRLRSREGSEVSKKTQFAPPLHWTSPDAPEGNWRFAPYVIGAVVLFMPGHTDLRFDERFFMFGEDEDLGWRVWRDGGTVIAASDAWAVHAGGTATATKWSPRMTNYRILFGRARFIRKHAGWRGLVQFLGIWSTATVRAKVAHAR